MKVLVACEFSGIVREEFKARGHDAWSCDLLPTEIPGNHIQDDVLNHLSDGWDLMIAHPPCTHLAVSGAAWFKEKIADGRQQEAINFFLKFCNTHIPKVAIENPIGIMSKRYRKPNQIIQPWMFGEQFSKPTCLWLKGLPKLVFYKEGYEFGKNDIVGRGKYITYASGKRMPEWYAKLWGNGKERSITFKGIAQAMAEQWG